MSIVIGNWTLSADFKTSGAGKPIVLLMAKYNDKKVEGELNASIWIGAERPVRITGSVDIKNA
jgi:hypothetical protein